MSTSSAPTEERLLQTVERRYKRRGYSVLLQPRGNNLPQFLSRFEPDMIAFKEQESVVVEVKPRVDLTASRYLTELADAVNSQAGWRFDLAVVNPKHPPLIDEEVEHLGQAEIVARIGAIRQLVKAHQDEAAILLAWSAVEATLRLVAAQQYIDLESEQPASVIKKLYSLGVLSREDYEALQRGLRVRTIIVHGFRSPAPEPHLTETLIGRVEDLLHSHATDMAM